MVHPSFPKASDFHTHPYKRIIQNLVDIIYSFNNVVIKNRGIFVIIEKERKILLSYRFGFGENSIAEAKSRAMHKYLLLGGHRDKKIQIFCTGNFPEKEVESCCEKILSIYFNNPDIVSMKRNFQTSLKDEESELYHYVGKRFFKKINWPN